MFSLYHLFLFFISIFWWHTVQCSNNYETITEKVVLSKLFSIQMMPCFWCVHHHTNSRNHIIFQHFSVHLYLTEHTGILLVWSTKFGGSNPFLTRFCVHSYVLNACKSYMGVCIETLFFYWCTQNIMSMNGW